MMIISTLFSLVALFLVAVLAGLFGWRLLDTRKDRNGMSKLISTQPEHPQLFSSFMVRNLPEPARRYFIYMIAEGTPLFTVADITMKGQFSLGTKQVPNYLDMRAQQVLAAPRGFIWKTKAGKGLMQLSGSDSGSWTRFWMAGLVPVARFGGNTDHARAAFGRYIAEAIFWTPAALLPGPGVTWEAVNDNTARVAVRYKGLEQSVDIEVSESGEPTQVSFSRWSDANPENQYKFQPFGGYASNYKEFQGFCLPTHVEAGNFFGEDNYFPFFIVDVESIRFPMVQLQN